MLTAERLRKILHYNPKTGEFTRGGKPAGSEGKDDKRVNYVRIMVDGTRYQGHNLAWLYMTGKWPDKIIDHRDRDGLNNRWGNLREAGYSLNNFNRKIPKHNTSGVKGVRWNKHAKQWVVHIGREYLGYRKTKEEAIALRDQALRSVAP